MSIFSVRIQCPYSVSLARCSSSYDFIMQISSHGFQILNLSCSILVLGMKMLRRIITYIQVSPQPGIRMPIPTCMYTWCTYIRYMYYLMILLLPLLPFCSHGFELYLVSDGHIIITYASKLPQRDFFVAFDNITAPPTRYTPQKNTLHEE